MPPDTAGVRPLPAILDYLYDSTNTYACALHGSACRVLILTATLRCTLRLPYAGSSTLVSRLVQRMPTVLLPFVYLVYTCRLVQITIPRGLTLFAYT